MAARTPDDIRLRILALAAQGQSCRAICREVGVSKSAVARILAASAPEAPAPPPPAPADAKGVIGEVVSAAELVHERALAEHDPAVAGRAVVDLASATAIGARADKLEVQPGVWMTMAEIREKMAGIYRRVAQINAEYEAQHGPTRCPGCDCELRMAPMGADLPEVGTPAPELEQSNPALERARQTFARASQAVDQALEDGHLRAAQRANRQRTDVARVIVREERRERQRKAEGSVFFPAAETERHLDEIGQRMATLAAVPLMCGPCFAKQRREQVEAAALSSPG